MADVKIPFGIVFCCNAMIILFQKQKANKNDNDDDDDWGDDFTEDAIKKRMEELSDAAKGLAFTDDLEKSAEDRLNMIYELIKVFLTTVMLFCEHC